MIRVPWQALDQSAIEGGQPGKSEQGEKKTEDKYDVPEGDCPEKKTDPGKEEGPEDARKAFDVFMGVEHQADFVNDEVVDVSKIDIAVITNPLVLENKDESQDDQQDFVRLQAEQSAFLDGPKSPRRRVFCHFAPFNIP